MTQVISVIRKSSVARNSLRNSIERKAVRPAQAHHCWSANPTAPTSTHAMSTQSWRGAEFWLSLYTSDTNRPQEIVCWFHSYSFSCTWKDKAGKIGDIWLVKGLGIFIAGTSLLLQETSNHHIVLGAVSVSGTSKGQLQPTSGMNWSNDMKNKEPQNGCV